MPIEDVFVAVLPTTSDRVVGAGIVVESDLVLTCSHVVNEALGRLPNHTGRPSQDEKILIRLHLPRREFVAVIADGDECWTDPPAESYAGADLCILRILGGEPLPNIAQLPSINNLAGKEFRSAGFPPGWDIDFAYGTIRGRDKTGLYLLRPEAPLLGAINERGERLFNKQVRPPGVIHSGFSGGPLEVEGLITGIIVQAREKISDATAYMIPVAAFPERVASRVPKFVAAVFQAPRAPVPFVGRDAELAEITSILESHDAVLISSTFPGIGKTALATKLANQLQPDYPDGVFWVRAASDASATLFATVSAISVGTNLLLAQMNTDGLAYYLAQFVSTRRALIIYDDIRFHENLALLIPAGTRSKLILTSRTESEINLEGLGHFPLSLLTHDSALDLLCYVSGRSEAKKSEKDASEHLVTELGCLPLAIRLAGPTIRTLRCTINDYLTYLLEVPDLSWIDSVDSSENLSASFYLSFQTLISDRDREFFLCLGLSRTVPVRIEAVAVALDQTHLAARLCLRNLLRAGLCEWMHASSEVSLHPLLRRYARQLANKQNNLQIHRRLAVWFEKQLSIRDNDGSFRYSDLIRLEDIDSASSTIHHLVYLHDYKEAGRIAEVPADPLTRSGQHDVLLRIIAELERAGPLSPWLALYKADLILIGLASGEPTDPRSILTALSEQPDVKVASAALICLARDSYRNKNVDECKSLLLKAKELKQNSQPPDERGISYVLNELARLELGSSNGLREALKLHDEALRIQRSLNDVKGQAHTLRRIGSIFLRQKRNPQRASA